MKTIHLLVVLTITMGLTSCGKDMHIEFTAGLPTDDMKCSKPFPSGNSVARFAHDGSEYRMDRAQLLLCQNNLEKGYLKSYVFADMVGRPATHAYIDQSGALIQHIRFVPLAETAQAQRNVWFYIKEFGLWLILLLFTGTLLFLKKIKNFQNQRAKQTHQSGDLEIVWDHSSYPATEVIQSLAAGAVLSTINGFPLNRVNPQHPRAEMQEWLEGSWHIFDAQGFDYQFQSLMNFGHAYLFDRILSLCADEPQMLENPSQKIRAQLTKEFAEDVPPSDLTEHLDNLPATIAYLKNQSHLTTENILNLTTKAYDIDRAVTITRVAVGAGLLPNKVGLNYVMAAGGLARQLFSSWKEYATSVLLGRGIWGGVTDNLEFDYRVKTVELLLNDPQSPWVKIGWWPPLPEPTIIDEAHTDDLDPEAQTEDELDPKDPPVIH